MNETFKCLVCNNVLTPYFEKEGYDFGKCSVCNFFGVTNPPSMEKLIQYYEDDTRSQTNNAASFWARLPYKIFYNQISKYVHVGNVLDFGCGEGDLLKIIKNNSLCAVFGYDFDSNNVKSCVSKGVTCIGELDGSVKFDVIILRDVLEHLLNPDVVIGLLSENLCDDGVIILTVPNTESADFKGKGWELTIPPKHLSYFNRENLVMFMSGHGFFPLRLRDSKIPSYMWPYSLPVVGLLFKFVRLLLPCSKVQGTNLFGVFKKNGGFVVK